MAQQRSENWKLRTGLRRRREGEGEEEREGGEGEREEGESEREGGWEEGREREREGGSHARAGKWENMSIGRPLPAAKSLVPPFGRFQTVVQPAIAIVDR